MALCLGRRRATARFGALLEINGQFDERELSNPVTDGPGEPVAFVPEPTTWAMMLFGFGGIA